MLVPKTKQSVNGTNKNEGYAYVSLLCDDLMIEAAKTLIFTLSQTTKNKIIIMIMEQVQQRQVLESLGAELMVIDELAYPFPITQDKKNINKMCRYSKIHAWSLIKYEKVVFLDADTIVTQNVDELFTFPELSATRDIGDTFNSGVMVLKPSTYTFQAMKDDYLNAPSYNQGDQGFLNWFFEGKFKEIACSYNTMTKFKEFATWPMIRQQAKILHFSSETKPWNLHYFGHSSWNQNFDSFTYYIWWRKNRESRQFSKWEYKGMCDEFFIKSLNKQYLTDSVTVLIKDWDQDNIRKTILHYSSMEIVHKVVVIARHSQSILLSGVKSSMHGVKKSLEFLETKKDLNFYFIPSIKFDTRCVLMVDDRNLLSLSQVKSGFQSWRMNVHALTGFYPRIHEIVDQNMLYTIHNTKYSILTSNGLFFSVDLLSQFTCLMPENLHAFLSQNQHCNDIAFNMMVSGTTQLKPIAIQSDLIDDEARLISDLISKNSKMFNDDPRFLIGKCITTLAKIFHGNPLKIATVSVAPFFKIQFRKKREEQWNDEL